MRILFLEPCPHGVGGYYRGYHTAAALAADGHRVTMFYFGSRSRRPWSRRREGPHLTLIELPTLGGARLSKAVRACLTAGIAAFWPRDILHVFTAVHPENAAAILACRLLFRRYILDWDDFWQDTEMFRHGSRRVRWYLRTAEERGARGAAAVTAASDFLFGAARRLGCRRVHKLPNGCAAGYVRAVPREEARHRLGLPPDRLVLFAFGNGFPHGRAVLILECVSRLARTFPDLEVLTNVVPEVHLWESARADSPPALTPELRARFRGVGHIPDADIGVYVAAADFALFLVADVPAERACSPIRVTAYLGGGCPIATTDVPTEARRLVADFGAGVIGPDPAAIAAAIAAAWRDPGRMAAMKAGARAACASLAYDRIARDLAAFYEGVAQRPPDGVSSPR